MRLHRFYTTQKLTSPLIYTDISHIHQWKNVFRYELGADVILFGDGYEHTYKVESITKKEAVLTEIDKVRSKIQSKEITLGLAIIKRDNFELVLQKCTELGVTTFIPVITDRSLQKMFGLERLDKILIEATEQSGWGKVPKLEKVYTLKATLENYPCIMFDLAGTKINLIEIKNLADFKAVLIGPEGGFTESELQLATDQKATILSLGVSTLRAETASIVVSGIVAL